MLRFERRARTILLLIVADSLAKYLGTASNSCSLLHWPTQENPGWNRFLASPHLTTRHVVETRPASRQLDRPSSEILQSTRLWERKQEQQRRHFHVDSPLCKVIEHRSIGIITILTGHSSTNSYRFVHADLHFGLILRNNERCPGFR